MSNHPAHPHVHLPERLELKRIYQECLPVCESLLEGLVRDIRELLEEHGYTPTIKYRVKRFGHFYDKLHKLHRQAGGANAQITDLLGLRIVCPFLEDLDVVERLLVDRLEVVELERKGADNSFREFGYDSLHMLVRPAGSGDAELLPGASALCEVQLRTILQDAWAEVEHELVYKSDISLPNTSIRRKLAALNANLTLSDLIFQEIRDYQKELRLRGRQRRASVSPAAEGGPGISLSSEPNPSAVPAASVGPLPKKLATPLEKTMLAALEAHSSSDLPTAIGLYDQLLGMQLESKIRSLVFNHRGMARFALGDNAGALDDFTAAIAWDSENARGYLNRALAFRAAGEFARSIEDYTSALKVDSVRPEGFYGRAQSYCEMQLYSRALADCEQALALDQDFVPARELVTLIRRGVFGAV